MPYDLGPRDLDDPREERDVERPGEDLAAAFETWLDERESVARREIGGAVSAERYELAERTLEGVAVTAPAATALLLSHADRIPGDVGLFLSAAYARAPGDVVFFDVESPVPVGHLGFRLPAGKALVLDAPAHSTMAVEAAGLVVNRSRVESYFGYGGGAAFVNLGSCLTFGTEGPAVAVNLGEVRGGSGSGTPAVSVAHPRSGDRTTVGTGEVDRFDGLREYLDRLRAGLDGDRREVVEFLGGLEPAPARGLRAGFAGIVGGTDGGADPPDGATGLVPSDDGTDPDHPGDSTDPGEP